VEVGHLLAENGLRERSGKQCRERWFNHLDPAVSRRPWTEDEERVIFAQHRQHGNKWVSIASHLPGRTDNAIKNHYFAILRKALRRINKVIGCASTTELKAVKPAVLSLLTRGDQFNPEVTETCIQLLDYILIFSRHKPALAMFDDKAR
jgi:hypothetical protein